MNKKQIFALSLLLTFMASSTFAFELSVQEKVDKALTKKEVVVEQQKKLTPTPTLTSTPVLNKENSVNPKVVKVETEGVKPELTLEEQFFARIKDAKTEEERKTIYTEFKKLEEQKTDKKSELMEDKTKKIFTNFDLIIAKLDSVKLAVAKSVSALKENNMDLSLVDTKTDELNTHLDLAKTEKASAWIKMQEIDFAQEKEPVLIELGEVKTHLLISKDEIRKASLNLKELIFFIRGALTNLK